MENSSKALLIVGGVLIAVLMLSLFVYLYVTMHSFSNEYNSNIYIQKLQAFNAQFEVYNGRTNLTAQDIVTIVSMIEEYNSKNEGKITYSGVSITNKFDFMMKNQKDDDNKMIRFTCEDIQYDSNGKVNYIKFKKNS